VEPGQTVQAGSPLLTIVDLDRLELTGAAPVGSSARIKAGQSVAVTVEGLPSQGFTGTVDRVNPVAAAGTRTIPVYIGLANEQRLLRGGMFATGQVVVAEMPDALAVPKAAIREDAEGFYLLKLTDGAVVRQGIEQGDAWNGGQLIQITTGLVAGDVVVTAPLTQLQPGDQVEMVKG
jgi:RND family efflux transporter MFP subunit